MSIKVETGLDTNTDEQPKEEEPKVNTADNNDEEAPANTLPRFSFVPSNGPAYVEPKKSCIDCKKCCKKETCLFFWLAICLVALIGFLATTSVVWAFVSLSGLVMASIFYIFLYSEWVGSLVERGYNVIFVV